jgi:copper(I)-binding protein
VRGWLAGLAALLLAACGGGDAIVIDAATYRAPLVAGAPGVAYFTVTSASADRIVGVSSPEAAAVEMHATGGADGMAAMHMVDTVELPAGEAVVFGPGGLHLMVIDPKTLPAGATFPIQITLESGRVETISFRGADSGS